MSCAANGVGAAVHLQIDARSAKKLLTPTGFFEPTVHLDALFPDCIFLYVQSKVVN